MNSSHRDTEEIERENCCELPHLHIVQRTEYCYPRLTVGEGTSFRDLRGVGQVAQVPPSLKFTSPLPA